MFLVKGGDSIMGSNSNSSDSIPFFPTYESKLHHAGVLRVTWFQPEFSQTKYDYCERPISNACTIIAILVASKCHINKIQIDPDKGINKGLIVALATSILNGNTIHDKLRKRGKLRNVNLTVPEALKYTRKKARGLVEWKYDIYLTSLENSLYENIKKNTLDWIEYATQSHLNPDLYIVLTCNCRSVLLIWQCNCDSISLVDSHQNLFDRGAVIATTNKQNTKVLCLWFARLIRYFRKPVHIYELSFIYVNKRKK